ncbi:hypothetical protein O181_044783 [Austropuccinia psidii MF-1]|uniref:PIN domain-containing protein n=1 Tax=Austropuccinia psidii MF-1 TaxID=1389203 RepID=A0A9Q3DNZ2_9BASI|nr:hypothetical protein [Austropuccinia psidii MF-1]
MIDIILDTNILLGYLSFLKHLLPFLNSHQNLIIPQTILFELDHQKSKNRPVQVYDKSNHFTMRPIGMVARTATNWLLKSVTKTNPSHIIIQKTEEESDEIRKGDGDSRILFYARQLHNRGRNLKPAKIVTILSNDNMLRLRAESEGIHCLTMSEFGHSPPRFMNLLSQISIPPSNAIVLESSTTPSTSNSPQLLTKFSNKRNSKRKFRRSKSKNQPAPHQNAQSNSTQTSWVPVGQNTQFTFSATLEPDQSLPSLKKTFDEPGHCGGCKTRLMATFQVPRINLHHYCPTCCEVICKGCMKVTGCDWDCSGPFFGQTCPAMNCCSKGRISMWIELLCCLDSCFLSNQFKLSLKVGNEVIHFKGDQALSRYLEAICTMLRITKEEDRGIARLENLLLSSTLVELISQTLLSSRFSVWHLRSEVFLNMIELLKEICTSSVFDPWSLLNSEFFKTNTIGLKRAMKSKLKIEWVWLKENDQGVNSNRRKLKRLWELYPDFMQKAKDILEDQIECDFEMIASKANKIVSLPLCYALEKLFHLATKKKNQVEAVANEIQILSQVKVDEQEIMLNKLLELEKVYEDLLFKVDLHEFQHNNKDLNVHETGKKDDNQQDNSEISIVAPTQPGIQQRLNSMQYQNLHQMNKIIVQPEILIVD